MAKRVANAQMLLESSDYNMTEIAKIVGYDNPLYFSRVACVIVGVGGVVTYQKMTDLNKPAAVDRPYCEPEMPMR